MIPSEYGSTADLGEVAAQEVRDHEPPALVDLGPLERPGEQLQLRELHRLVDLLEDVVHVRPRLDEVGREPQSLRGGVCVLEPAGVGDEADVEGFGDLGSQPDAERIEQITGDLGCRGRIRDDEVDGSEARVVVMVIDVDDERGLAEDRRVRPDAALVRAVDGEQDARLEVLRRLTEDLAERQEAVLGRERRCARKLHDHVLAQRAQAERGTEHRPERIAVGVLVGNHEKAVVPAEGVDDRVEISQRRCLLPHHR